MHDLAMFIVRFDPSNKNRVTVKFQVVYNFMLKMIINGFHCKVYHVL